MFLLCVSSIMVPPPGVEPRLANYLLHTGYKSAVLPLNYRGIKLNWLRRLDSNQRSLAYETSEFPLLHRATECLYPPQAQIYNLCFVQYLDDAIDCLDISAKYSNLVL